jgi:hypothetical protein
MVYWNVLLMAALAITMMLSAGELGAQREKAKWCQMVRNEIRRVYNNPGETFEMSPEMVRLYNTCTEEDFNLDVGDEPLPPQ